MFQSTKRIFTRNTNKYLIRGFCHKSLQRINVLGIETSCDDTGVAVVSDSGEILSENLVTHSQIVAQWGGVFPSEMAKAHRSALQGVVDKTINSIDKSTINAVAVTNGPGLHQCLNVGIQVAQQLSQQLNVPLISIHHLEAHILLVRGLSQKQKMKFPFLVLLVSGGHCMIVKAKSLGNYEIMGETQDDSIGEAFDKVARLLNLDVSVKSGGYELEMLIKMYGGDPNRFKFPIPLSKGVHKKELSFSFAGLKSSILWHVRKLENQDLSNREINNITSTEKNKMRNKEVRLPMRVVADIAASFQHSAVTHLLEKTKLAIKMCMDSDPEMCDLVLCGGVAANKLLRSSLENLCESHGYNLHTPPIKYCTDNGVMVAWAGVERFLANKYTSQVPVKSRWSLEQCDEIDNTKSL